MEKPDDIKKKILLHHDHTQAHSSFVAAPKIHELYEKYIDFSGSYLEK